jgi:anti-sigma-K factor RskA
MNTRPDDDTLIQFVLGTLEPEKAKELELLVQSDPTLATQVTSWQKGLALLGTTVPQSSPSADLEYKILSSIQSLKPVSVVVLKPVPSNIIPMLIRALSFAAVATAVLFGWRSNQLGQEVAQLKLELLKQTAVVSEGSLIKLASNTNISIGQAMLTKSGQLMVALKLPAPESGKTYQAWVILKGETAPRPLKTLSTDLSISIPASAVAIAISLEPMGGSLTPTEVLGGGAIKL